ncbi:phosphatases II [Marasmius fiardii PR-910]|nr:phosphatases II [Marasmius fiardii PR-910]
MSTAVVVQAPTRNELIPEFYGLPTQLNTGFIAEREEEISRLASQHHFSEYSRSKFGPQGAPFLYIPLSIQAPEVFQELRSRQVQSSTTKIWWNHQLLEPASPATPVLLGPSGLAPGAGAESDELSRELSAAMDEQLTSPQVGFGQSRHNVKTSVSHPIKLSLIIPSELLALVSSHLLLTSSVLSPSIKLPTIFELPSPFTLDRLTNIHHPISRPDLQTIARNPPPSFFGPHPPFSETQTTFACHLQARSHVPEALQAAMNSRFQSGPSLSSLPPPPFIPSPRQKVLDGIPPYENCTRTVKTFHTTATTPSVALAVSVTQVNNTIDPFGDFGTPPSSTDTTRLYSPPTPFQRASFGVEDEQPQVQPPTPPPPPSPLSTVQTSTLGNLLLSSCPGKKVRLDGPVKGRSVVCRDLESDLRRMKDMGIGCIVCCLDDSELEFLGASWPEYERITKMIGMDVLRLPTPEGLPPALSPEALDRELTSLIDRYTVNGVSVLVHCRGGVGRAGVVACCWTIKLGLCGWLDQNQNAVSASSTESPPTTPSGNPAGSIRLVEKVISVIRRRRGAKAVETYEQAKFLVDYVEYLRERD